MEITQEKLLEGARNLKAKGYTPQQVNAWLQTKGSSLDDMKSFVKSQAETPQMSPMTDEQRAQAEQAAKEWREQVKPRTVGDVVSDFLVTNPVARQGGFVMQGITNAGLNPIGQVAKALKMNTKPLEAQTAGERISELAGQYGYDAAGFGTLLKGAALANIGGNTLKGNIIRTLGEGGVPLALTGSTGSAIVTGAVNPQNPIARTLTDIAGGGVAGVVAARPSLSTATKQEAKSIKQLVSELGQDVLSENMKDAKRTGRSLLEVGSDEVVQAAQKARQQTPQARKLLTERMTEIAQSQPKRTRAVIDEALGSQGKNSTIAEVAEAARQEAQPIYNKLQNVGDLSELDNTIAKDFLVKNPFLRKEIESVVKDPLYQAEYAGQKVSPTDWRILDQANRSINDKISAAFRAGENDKVRLLERQKYELLNKVDSVVPEYKTARRIYENARQFEKAADLGRDVFNGRQSVEDFQTTINALSASEKRAAKIGLRDELVNKIGSSNNENMAVKKFLPENVREKIITLAGKDDGKKIINEAEQAVKLNANINKLFSGSQTSEKQNLRDVAKGLRGFLKKPWESGVDVISKPFDKSRNIRLAEYLTNPEIVNSYDRVMTDQARNATRTPSNVIYLQNALRSIFENTNKE